MFKKMMSLSLVVPFLSIISISKAAALNGDHPSELLTSETRFLPYVRPRLARNFLQHQGVPGILGFGMNGLVTPQGISGLYGGLGITSQGYQSGNSFGNQRLAKLNGGGGYGLQNGFRGIYSNKAGYGNQYSGGNSNTFAKEKVFSQNKNFGSMIKGGFSEGYGVQSGHQGIGGYGGLGVFGQGESGGQGLYSGQSVSTIAYGSSGNNFPVIQNN